jgi:hypothetical protein
MRIALRAERPLDYKPLVAAVETRSSSGVWARMPKPRLHVGIFLIRFHAQFSATPRICTSHPLRSEHCVAKDAWSCRSFSACRFLPLATL